ncbi:MAG TPA: hypothetical protein VHS78_07620, partial [Candidatus Elarobacter sp.]|nr:hypothetical protein [Candidatus Elarobacter sp.]
APGEELRYWLTITYPRNDDCESGYALKLFYADIAGKNGSAQAWLSRRESDAGHAYWIPGEGQRARRLRELVPAYKELDRQASSSIVN